MFLVTCFCSFLLCIHYTRCTEITVLSSMIDDSLGMEIHLPTLMCHVKHTGYRQVTWYKDYSTVKRGSADLEGHLLSLRDLLNSSLPSDASFDSPLKLQGYYWCETEDTVPSTIHNFLFRIREIYTFVGKFVATKDSLGEDKNLNLKDKLSQKMELYEDEMENLLFEFLPPPSVHLTSMKVSKEGLEVRFFLYVRRVIQPRKPVDNELLEDRDHLDIVNEYLRNETSELHPEIYNKVRDWMNFLGIDAIYLRSTLGCYEETLHAPSVSAEKVTWPSARIGEVVIPENACSTKDGLAVTRLCTGSFYIGAKWGNPSGKCERAAEGITLELRKLYEDFGREQRASYIRRFARLMQHPEKLGVTDLHIAVDILNELSLLPKLDRQEISGMLSVIDAIVETNRTELIAAKSIVRLTSRILRVFDNLLEQATEEEKEIQISKRHLMVDTTYTGTGNDSDRAPVLGLAVLSPDGVASLRLASVHFLAGGGGSTPPERDGAMAYFVLPAELVLSRESRVPAYRCQLNMVFFGQWYLFQNPKEALVRRNYKVLPSSVLQVSLSGGPAWNLTDPVQLFFKDTVDIDVEDPVCVHYDPRMDDGAGAWSPEGCEYRGLKNGYYHCQCRHLSIFAVVLSQSPEAAQKPGKTRLGAAVYVGCGVSMLALSVAVLLYILSKNWRQTVDHSVLFCLSLTFLVCIVVIFISEMYFARRTGCIVLAVVLHHAVLSVFAWLAVQAVIYRLRFAKKTDVGEIPHFVVKSALVAWGIPALIVIIMWLSREYPCAKDNCWLTVSEVSKEALIPVVVLVVVTLCINACATYSLTCRYKKDFLIGDSSYNDVAIKFRVAFTIFFFFVLSWLFGFFALHKKSRTLRILFSICMTLTAYYVTLFFIFQEVSFWDLCTRCKKAEDHDETPPVVQYKAKTYNTSEECDVNAK